MPKNREEEHSSMTHTPYTSYDEGLLGATMCHGSLCDLYQHCKHGFLSGTDKVQSQFSSIIHKLLQPHLPVPAFYSITCREKHRSSGVHSPVASIRWAASYN